MTTSIVKSGTVTLQTGTRNFGPFSFPNGLHQIVMNMGFNCPQTPNLWTDPATELDVLVEVSYDGGATFVGGGGVTGLSGGVPQFDKQGNQLQQGGFIASYSAVPTQVRATTTVRNGPLVTTFSLDAQ